MTVFRYVDTAASASGDGTNRTHNTGSYAYDSLFNAEADIDLDWANIAAVGDDLTVKCAGSTADTTAVYWSALSSDATYTLTIMGDDGAADPGGDDAAQYDDDGRYEGPLDWSTSHYRIDQSAANRTIEARGGPMVFDGIQVKAGFVGIAGGIRVYNEVTPAADYIVENCRVTGVSDANNRCIDLGHGTVGCTAIVRNCIITKPSTDCAGYGIDCLTRDGITDNYTIRNCTIYGGGAGSSIGIRLYEYGATSAGALDIRNCVIGNFSNDYDRAGTTGNTTVAGSYNASDDNDIAAGPNTGDITLGTHTDEWVDPTGTSLGDFNFTPKAGGQLIEAANSAYSTTYDAIRRLRDTSSPDVGAIEAVAFTAWGNSWGDSWSASWKRNSAAHPVNPFGHPLRGPFAGPIS